MTSKTGCDRCRFPSSLSRPSTSRDDRSHAHDRAALLEEATNWPTYYPSKLSAEEILRKMTAY